MDSQLTPEIVLHGYRLGIFPMADRDGEVYWYSPDPRCILEYSQFRVPRSLRPVLNKRKFEIRVNTAFTDVVRACANRKEGTWISEEIIDIYSELHHRGHAHCVEAWHQAKLVGGLYGITVGGAFCGESMFYHVSDASKVALVALMRRLKTRGFTLVDTQWTTPYLKRLGAIEIPRTEYLRRLERALLLPCTFARLTLAFTACASHYPMSPRSESQEVAVSSGFRETGLSSQAAANVVRVAADGWRILHNTIRSCNDRNHRE